MIQGVGDRCVYVPERLPAHSQSRLVTGSCQVKLPAFVVDQSDEIQRPGELQLVGVKLLFERDGPFTKREGVGLARLAVGPRASTRRSSARA